jgi:hypothetical protein
MTLEVGDHACILHQKFVSEKLHQFKGLGLMHISYRPCETSVRVVPEQISMRARTNCEIIVAGHWQHANQSCGALLRW